MKVFHGLNLNFRIRYRSVYLLAAILLPAIAPFARGADPWTPSQIVQPEDLARQLADSKNKPLLVHVGFLTLYKQAHIPGSEFCGPASKPEGLEQLEKCVRQIPRSREIVIYCGCCPWNDCPNIRPAFEALRKMGFTRLKVLYIPQNFGRDWVKKGFPVESAP